MRFNKTTQHNTTAPVYCTKMAPYQNGTGYCTPIPQENNINKKQGSNAICQVASSGFFPAAVISPEHTHTHCSSELLATPSPNKSP